MMKQKTSISLIISTYNSPLFLELILLSILNQKKLPDEVVIANDGSTIETQQLVEKYQLAFPVPLIHVWHEDDGFRQSVIKNKAVARASGEYLIFLDGDLLLNPYFVYDYKKNIREGFFLVASRAFLSEAYTIQLLQSKQTIIDLRSKNFEKNKIAALRIPWAHHFIKGSKTHYAARGGLMGIFKKDYIAVNGFNEAFKGWGREDSELFVRLINNKLKRKNLKFAAITYHLWHQINSRERLIINDALLENAIREKSIWCKEGIDKYL
ncbi:MAG: glycosyltransferase family 2 protein [Ferruginibacter sp.]